VPGTPPLVQPRKIQEQEATVQICSRSLPAQQQACQPVTKDEYCINTVERKLKNKQKECREGHQN
jgi:hypothetical protein